MCKFQAPLLISASEMGGGGGGGAETPHRGRQCGCYAGLANRNVWDASNCISLIHQISWQKGISDIQEDPYCTFKKEHAKVMTSLLKVMRQSEAPAKIFVARCRSHESCLEKWEFPCNALNIFYYPQLI